MTCKTKPVTEKWARNGNKQEQTTKLAMIGMLHTSIRSLDEHKSLLNTIDGHKVCPSSELNQKPPSMPKKAQTLNGKTC